MTKSRPPLCDPTGCGTPGSSVLRHMPQSWLRFTSIETAMRSNHLNLSSPLRFLPSILPSIRVFSNESALRNRWPKYGSFSFSPFNEHSGLISFRIDWSDLLAVHGLLKNFLQHHNLKASIFQHSAFFMVQLSHLYTYWKNHSFDYTDLYQQSNVSAFYFLFFGTKLLNLKEWY